MSAIARLSGMDIKDTLAFLVGTWEVERSIDDHRSATRGLFVGVGELRREPSSRVGEAVVRAIYDEEGELQLGDHVGSARRHLEYRGNEDGSVSLYFLDGRHFVDLDLVGGICNVTHRCNQDSYHISVAVSSMQSYVERWRVIGPNKDYEARTRYTRVPG
ncbi:MAG TPA: DUF6314 family protein [Acidimicrobiales bacterium]|nr:DUF6314 family protein [Acidimicrobiales bacterium]